MTDSWKIGAVSGLLVGAIGAIIGVFLGVYLIEIGLPFWALETLPIIPFKELVIVEIPLYIISGIVLGISARAGVPARSRNTK